MYLLDILQALPHLNFQTKSAGSLAKRAIMEQYDERGSTG